MSGMIMNQPLVFERTAYGGSPTVRRAWAWIQRLRPPHGRATATNHKYAYSDSFKVSLAFPIGHCGIERGLFGSEEVRVMLDHVFAECAPCEFARRKSVRGFGERVRHAGQVFRGVNVADEAFGRFDLVGYAVQPRSQRGGEREIGVAIGAGNSAFDAQ